VESILGLADHVTWVRNSVSLFPNMEANNGRHCMAAMEKAKFSKFHVLIGLVSVDVDTRRKLMRRIYSKGAPITALLGFSVIVRT
jgi:hypothetical protein